MSKQENWVSKALKAATNFLGAIEPRAADRRVRPTKTVGVPGTAMFGGYPTSRERERKYVGREKFTTYSEAMVTSATLGAGVRFYLNLLAKSKWAFTPAEHPDGDRLAEEAECIFTKDPETPWPRIVRRAAMYRFYGFSVQEWTEKP